MSEMDEFSKPLDEKQNKSIATYIQRLYLELERTKNEKDYEKLPHQLGIFKLKEENSLNVLKRAIRNAMDRKDLICDYDDSKHPSESTGKCQDEEHYENVQENYLLNEEQREVFDKISNKQGWYEACKHFDEILNPENQKLKLTLGYDDDNSKLNDNEPIYICETCMNVLVDNADGMVSCDMDSYEPD